MILMRYKMGIIVVGEFIVFVFIFKKKKSSFFIFVLCYNVFGFAISFVF
jgi:hypothetical protein